MGTTFYLIQNACPNCGRGEIKSHIGKSCVGWCFMLHVKPEESILSFEDWKRRIEKDDSRIVNEYGDNINKRDFYRTVEERYYLGDYWNAKTLKENHAILGPKGLARLRIGNNCIGHGKGTYDLVVGNFT